MILGPRNGTNGFMGPAMGRKFENESSMLKVNLIPKRFFSGSRGRVPVPSVSGSSEAWVVVVVLGSPVISLLPRLFHRFVAFRRFPIPRRFFSGSWGRVPVPSMSGSSEVVMTDQKWTLVRQQILDPSL
ncbi:hypothetical protein AgCh_017959 [Apium graveolens]